MLLRWDAASERRSKVFRNYWVETDSETLKNSHRFTRKPLIHQYFRTIAEVQAEVNRSTSQPED